MNLFGETAKSLFMWLLILILSGMAGVLIYVVLTSITI